MIIPLNDSRPLKIYSDFREKVIIPRKVRPDEIPTLNRMGYMKLELDDFSKGFLEFASQNKKSLSLEIGCAYGFVASQALAKGVKLLVNDLDQRHLNAVLQSAPRDKINNLSLHQGAFPEELNLPASSLVSVLASRVMHFLTGEELEAGLIKIHQWLQQNGKLFFVACTPYHYAYESFLPIYQANVSSGQEWPGMIYNQREVASEHADYIPDFTHVFSKEQLEALLPKHGFAIEKITYFDYQNNDSNGKGHIGFVARKI